MLRNNFPIARIFSIAFIGISILFFTILFNHLTRTTYGGGYSRQNFDEQEMIALGCALASFTIGLGFFFKLKWARFLATLIIFVIAGFFIFLLTLMESSFNKIISVGGIACVVAIALTFGLLMYNTKLSEEFKDIPLEDEYDEAIDNELMV